MVSTACIKFEQIAIHIQSQMLMFLNASLIVAICTKRFHENVFRPAVILSYNEYKCERKRSIARFKILSFFTV
ncbi:Hypothetical predicted protein [Octopus vulgaris]|uniref:Uncharacterized protein n=1 Tax=Octopus vulgaris TaxID=6645 RepID=A0AA36AKU8_OCTVU|nr:Hypothetical predicted protein [Octopus vulgaris]